MDVALNRFFNLFWVRNCRFYDSSIYIKHTYYQFFQIEDSLFAQHLKTLTLLPYNFIKLYIHEIASFLSDLNSFYTKYCALSLLNLFFAAYSQIYSHTILSNESGAQYFRAFQFYCVTVTEDATLHYFIVLLSC